MSSFNSFFLCFNTENQFSFLSFKLEGSWKGMRYRVHYMVTLTSKVIYTLFHFYVSCINSGGCKSKNAFVLPNRRIKLLGFQAFRTIGCHSSRLKFFKVRDMSYKRNRFLLLQGIAHALIFYLSIPYILTCFLFPL